MKFIAFLILVFAFWQNAGDSFIDISMNAPQGVNEKDIAIYHQSKEATITVPQLPYLPDAELAGTAVQSHLLTFLRIQRSSVIDGIFSIKGWVNMLAQREVALFLHQGKLYQTAATYRCHSACEYYVYTLRRILI